ncbi:MAG: efflux RND transporter periplasmic adaptor subunit, partial [Saprospiraceae bacterium]
MNAKTLRRIGIFVGALLIVAGLAVRSKLSSQKKAPPRKPKISAPIPPVKTMVVNNENVSTTLNIQGELVAFEKVDLFTEVTGVLEETSKPFKKGTYFPKGSLLLSIDDEEARLSILSQKSNLMNAITQMMPDLKIDYPASFQNWQTYLQNFDVKQTLKAFPQPVNDQEKYFVASRNLQTQFYNIKSAEARLNKYKIYSPFSGVLLEGSLNIGTLVRANQQLGTLMNTGNYELEATIALGDLKFIKPGNS